MAATIVATGSASSAGVPSKSALAEGEVEWSAEVDLSTGELATTKPAPGADWLAY